MEPRPSERGNLVACSGRDGPRQLQWSHVLPNVETAQCNGWRGCVDRRFNGATSFRTWKRRSIARPLIPVEAGFNGATSFRTWKRRHGSHSRCVRQDRFNGATSFRTWKPALAAAPTSGIGHASMEPRPSERGNSSRAKATDNSICMAACERCLPL